MKKETDMKLTAGAELKHRYGSVPTGIHLKVLDVGFDWVLVKYHGKVIYVPNIYLKD